jgi:hypothetical protein
MGTNSFLTSNSLENGYAVYNFSDGEISMGKFSELVKVYHDEEVKLIEEAGNIWITGIGLAIGFLVIWGGGLLFNDRLSNREITVALILIVIVPLINRAWARHQVASQMRHEREIRMEVKLDALLGIVKIDDGEW